MLLISKIFAVLIDPAGFTLTVFAAAILLAVIFRKPRTSVVFFICGFLLLLVLSSPVTSYFLMRGLESQYPPSGHYGQASAVVLLGGSTVGKNAPRTHVEINYAGNRIHQAARVFRQSGAARLVLTGGLVDYINDEVIPEANAMFELMNELFGIDTADVILENKSQNTRENAVNTKLAMAEAGLGNDIILVTSAYHMPRSAAVFKKAGFEITPAPTGFFKSEMMGKKPLMWLPSSTALFESSIAIREYLGYMAYKLMGWL